MKSTGGVCLADFDAVNEYRGISDIRVHHNLRYLRSRVLQRAGKPREALEEFREVAARAPKLFEPRVRISECLAASEGPASAEEALRKALSEGPSAAVPLWERWVVLCLRDLEMEPLQVRALLPPEGDGSKTGAPAYTSDLGWLLERLSTGDAVLINCGGKEDSWFQDREQWHSGANFFALGPGRVMGYARNVHTLEEMSRHGFEIIDADSVIDSSIDLAKYRRYVVTIQGAELARGGGGCRCMSLPVSRRPVNW